jgi:hypothetical protein
VSVHERLYSIRGSKETSSIFGSYHLGRLYDGMRIAAELLGEQTNRLVEDVRGVEKFGAALFSPLLNCAFQQETQVIRDRRRLPLHTKDDDPAMARFKARVRRYAPHQA